ncbi:MAG: helix-turn-helix transcriptional regulator [Clostridium sp.]|nr:helix-turn-helix transcriptional regulator [Clostridium sp.]MCM1173264.1 helix-turn-helix transcriptional regulator [Clostridium sp.]MCM1209914.1 helix-turn-helix transcriptional regulator [Ruminococcus sp.]
MTVNTACPCTKTCPLQKISNALGGKWKLSILCSLSSSGSIRYNDLKRKIKGISNTMLAKSLKELEENGLVKRTEYMEVPIRVEYETTNLTHDLLPILAELAKWSINIK